MTPGKVYGVVHSPSKAPDGCQAEGVSDPADGACLVELVLSAGEFGPQAEPALRRLRDLLEVPHQHGPILDTGMAVTQEFGKLDVTVRALVSAVDLVEGAALGTKHLRQAIGTLALGAHPAFQEQSVRASWT